MAVSRFAASQGQVVRLRVLFKRSVVGDLYDPDDIAGVEVHFRTGTETTVLVQSFPDTDVVREAVGVYYVDWAIPPGATVGFYEDRWAYTPDAGDPERVDVEGFQVFLGTPGTGEYLTASEISANYLPGTGLTDAQIQELIQTATGIVDRYCGRWFDIRVLEVLADGKGDPFITLPYKPRTVDSIVVTLDDDTTETRPASEYRVRGKMLIHRSHRPWPISSGDPCGTSCCAGGSVAFPYGHRNVAVTGSFGSFDVVPPAIRRAVGLLVMHGGQDDKLFAPMAGNYQQESVEGRSYSIRDAVTSVNIRGSTGIPEVDHLLNMYRNMTGRVGVL